MPWSLLIGFFTAHGFDMGLFLQQVFANQVTSAFAADLILSGVIFLCFAVVEIKRSPISPRWLVAIVVLTFGVGLSCSLPFFFYLRERQANKTLAGDSQ